MLRVLIQFMENQASMPHTGFNFLQRTVQEIRKIQPQLNSSQISSIVDTMMVRVQASIDIFSKHPELDCSHQVWPTRKTLLELFSLFQDPVNSNSGVGCQNDAYVVGTVVVETVQALADIKEDFELVESDVCSDSNSDGWQLLDDPEDANIDAYDGSQPGEASNGTQLLQMIFFI
jgi:hypothetical protein